jgi:hypothetical protein
MYMNSCRSFLLKICFIFYGGCVLQAAQRQPSHEVFANPIVDVAFRHIMSNKKIAKSLINSIVPDFKNNPVTKITKAFDKVPLSPKKDAFMDFHAKTQGRNSVIIEMQARRHTMFDERALYYAAYTYSHQLSEEILPEPDWYKGLKPVYAIQFLDYDTQRIRGIQPREGEEDLDQLFLQEVKAHPMPEDAFMKYYVMVDQFSSQKVKRGIHLIQIELPRVTRIRGLSPRQEDFVEKSEGFSLSDWWYCVLKHAEEFDIAGLGNEYEDRSGQFDRMPKPVYNAFKMLRREAWGSKLRDSYNREASEMGVYSTAIAVERAEGREEGREEGRQEGEMKGQMKGFIEQFILLGKLGPKSLQRIKRNQPDEDWIDAIWNERETEMAELESGEEEEEVPEGRTFDDFIAYLRAEGVIRKKEGE